MLNEGVYRSPKWLRNFLDFEVSTGQDIKGEPSKRRKRLEILKKWDRRWRTVDTDSFKDFYEEVYKDETKRFHRGWIFNSDLDKIRDRHRGDMTLWDKYDRWIREKEEDKRNQARIERDILDLYNSIIEDFTKNPYSDKFSTESVEGSYAIVYRFENGDLVKKWGNHISYKNKLYTVGLIYRNKFTTLFNDLMGKAKRRNQSSSSWYHSSSSSKAKSTDPKRVKYDTLNSKIKLRQEQLDKMSKTDPDYNVLKNELDTYKRIRDKMKADYKFENLTNFESFNQYLRY